MKYATINYNEINSSLRFDGSYHLSEGVLYSSKIQKMKFDFLGNLASEIFTAGRTKRIYTSKEKGYPYLSNSDISKNNPFENCNFNSKKHGFDEKSVLKEGMIVTGRVGAIGQTSYINSEYEELKAMGSDNIIRITAKDKKISGYIYAYLVSKYGNTFFHKLASGGVQPYISEEMIKAIPVPLLEEKKQQLLHQLIVDSANLRVEANQYLKECLELFDFMDIKYKSGGYITSNICINKINDHKKRFDANYNVVSANVENIINKQNIEFVTLKDLTSGIFIGPRSKRNYVQNGIPFLSTSEMQKANPTKTEKFISEKASKGFIVKEGWLLTTRSGTLGDTVYSLPCIEGFAVSEDAIRIVLKDNSAVSNKYLFAFLKSNIGINSLVSGSYGSVILHLNEEYIGDIKVPILDKDKILLIETKIEIYLSNINQAILQENQVIDLIEKEIDAWQ